MPIFKDQVISTQVFYQPVSTYPPIITPVMLNTLNGPPHLLICHQRVVHKRKISWIVLYTNTYFVLNCNVLALFTFYALPSVGKSKDAVVHYHSDVGLELIVLASQLMTECINN